MSELTYHRNGDSVENYGRDYVLSLKGKMAHAATLGTDARGNIQRIDNMLAAMEERLLQAQTQLGNLEQQREAAQQEVGKPFPQEDELREKSTRLAELDAQLNLGGEREAEQDKDHEERETSDSTEERQLSRPSVLAGLRKSAAEIQTDKKPYQHHEAKHGELER